LLGQAYYRIHRYLERRTQHIVHIGGKAAVYTPAILEYRTPEFLVLAGLFTSSTITADLFVGNTSKDTPVKRIALRHRPIDEGPDTCHFGTGMSLPS